jgi:hypothetical protein
VEGLAENTGLALVVSVVALATLLARILESVVSHLLEERRNRKNGKRKTSLPVKGGATTTDLALQSVALNDIHGDLDETRRIVYDTKAAVTKDLPHTLVRVDEKLGDLILAGKETNRELEKELRDLRRSIENNSAATKALHNFLASQQNNRS